MDPATMLEALRMMGQRQQQNPMSGMGGNFDMSEMPRSMLPLPSITSPNTDMRYRNEWTDEDANRILQAIPLPMAEPKAGAVPLPMRRPAANQLQPVPLPTMQNSPMPQLSDADMARLRELLMPQAQQQQQMPMPMPMMPFGALR